MSVIQNTLIARMAIFAVLSGAVAFGQCTGTSTSSTCTSQGGSTTLTSTPAPPGTGFPQRASVFPITNAVSGMTGTITSISVRLNGLSHTDPDDMDMLLVSPDGRAFVFWSDIGGIRNRFDQAQFGGTNVCLTQTPTGGACSISNFTITVADNGATRLPDSAPQAGRDTRVLVNNTTYQPANGENGFDAFSNTSPAFSAGVTLGLANYAQNTTSTTGTQLGGTGTFANIFNGSSNVNGDWKLYIALDSCCFTDASNVTHNDVGSLTSWSLIITTAANNAATTTSLTSSANPSLIPSNNNVTFTASVTSNGNPVTLGSVSFFRAGNVLLGTANINLNASGQASVTVSNLTEGTHAITAQYSGATGFANSTGSLTQTVNRATTISGNTFCNTGPIAIPSTFTPNPAATPYPSNLFVTGLNGAISKVALTLNNYNMTQSGDADVLLVGPTGAKFIPFSFVGGNASTATAVNFVLDDDAPTRLSNSGSPVSGTYRPSVNNTLGVSFPSPAPAGPHAAAATVGTATFANTFGGLAPNGTWQLFVSTHGGINSVSNFNGGWCLTFTTSGDPASTTTPSVNPSPSAVNQSTTVAALVTNASTSAPVNARGSVNFFENSTLLAGPLNVGSNGIASFTKSDFTQGAHFVDANYSGSPGFFNLSTGRVLHYVDAATTNPATGQFCNASSVAFPNVIGVSGSPYPTRVNVTGMAGVLSKATLSLRGLTHNFPKDMDMMLTGPNGNSLVVLSDVGGTSPLTTAVDLTLDSTVGTSLPASGALTTGTFRPTDFFDGTDTWAAPAPTTNRFLGSTSVGFTDAFPSINPNGLWTLWTTNDGAGASGGGTLANGWCLNLTMTPPQLTISKTHVGNFTQGQTGATYTVTVGSSGPGSTVGTITVVDTVPTGLTITNMSGSGWTCTVNTRTCTTTAALAANGTLPPITVTVNVATNATSPLVNSVAVSGGGATGATANDSTIITSVADLTISKTTSSTFVQGGTASYTLAVTNSGAGASSGNITVSDTLPTGLTTSGTPGGTGWDCTASTSTFVNCVRTTSISAGTSAPAITVNVNIASNTAASITNTATVAGGGEVNTSNNTGSVTNSVSPAPPDLTVTKTVVSTNPVLRGGQVTFRVQVNNTGTNPTSGSWTLTDNAPTGLTFVTVSGGLTTCTGNTTAITCTQSTVIPAGGNLSVDILCNIAPNAPASITNTASVTGGGETNTTNNAGTATINPVDPADLTVTKVAVGTFQQGGSASYNVTVTNSGTGATTIPYTITDTMPSGLTAGLVTSADPGWNCTASTSTVVSCTRSNALAPTASTTLNIPVTIASNTGTSVTNTAFVTGGGEVVTNNNAGSSVTGVTQLAPDLTVTKVAQGGPFQQGGTVTYLITVTNGGNGPTTGTISMSDTIPTGLTVTSVGGDASWTCTNAQPVTCARTTPLAAGANSVITLSANIASTAPTSITNTATVATTGESNSGNNANSSVISVGVVAPDLTVTKVAQGSSFQQGGTVTYLITVTNGGNGPTTGTISMSDTIPTGLTVTSVSGGADWVCNNAQPVTCARTTPLAAGANSVITLSANIASNASTSITNTATVSTTGESNSSNNANSSVISVGVVAPDLTVTKVAQGSSFQQGGTVTYLITVTNGGNGPTTGTINMSDTIPTGLTVTSVSGGADWVCNNAQPVTCARANALAAGANSVITLTADIASNASTSITNTATVATTGESNSSNNANSSVISVNPVAPDLTITKVAQGGPFQQGGVVAYVLTVTNGGNGPTTGTISVSDTIPTGLTVTSVSGANWTCINAQPVTCSRTAALAPGANSAITLTANIASNAPSTILNTATVATQGESNSGNNANSSLISVGALTSVTITVPAGISYTFNSQTVTGSQTFNVAPGSYTLSTTTPQSLGAGTQAVWASWSNGQPISHSVTVGSTAISITGSFTTQFQLTTAASPSNGGTVTPASGSFFDSGTVVNVTATPNGGFTFANWTGPVANASAAVTTVTMSGPQTIAANFAGIVIAPDVTSQLSVSATGPIFNRGTGRFSQTLTLTNNGSALAASAVAFDNLAAGYTVFTPSGFTVATAPAGSAYVEVGAIPAGGTATVTVQFTRVGIPTLTYTTRVLGAGSR